MSKRVDLSIVIVNFNTKDFLRECLNSIRKNVKGKKEVIVVDNGSSDGSIEYLKDIELKRYGDLEKKETKSQIFCQSISLKVILNKHNLGFTKANNQAINHAQGKYILLLNPDTVIPKGTLSFMVKYMDKNKDVGIATCRVELPSGELDDACHRGFPTPWNAFCHFIGLASLFPKSNFFNGYHLGYQNIDRVHEIDACVGAFLLIRREAGEKVGWLDEDYFWYGEDLDLCFRVKRKGWKIMFVPNVKIIHHKGIASGIKKNSFLISQASRNTKILATNARFDVMRIFYNKHYGKRYPQFIRWLVLAGIEIKRKIVLLRI